MTDEKVKEEFEKWFDDPEMSKEESAFPNQFEDSEVYETEFFAHGFYAGFRTAERLAKIEVLESVLSLTDYGRTESLVSDIQDMIAELKAGR